MAGCGCGDPCQRYIGRLVVSRFLGHLPISTCHSFVRRLYYYYVYRAPVKTCHGSRTRSRMAPFRLTRRTINIMVVTPRSALRQPRCDRCQIGQQCRYRAEQMFKQ
ncbi:hypothetical protein K445DRAFT_276105 [Daldinia sp. EC12]|nr:hypothetical protein K445DRAFT_276105 [Daldinia sp. EC12]